MRFLIAVGEGEVRDSFFTARVLKEMSRHGEILYNETGNQAFTKEELMAHMKGIDVLFTGWGSPRVDEDVLNASDCLRVHAHTGGSVASYVSRQEYDRGVTVLSGNDVYARSVAEGCLCYTLMGLRRAYEYAGEMKTGGWKPKRDYTCGLIGRRIGIVGYGAISSYYIELLKWFHPEIWICSKYITEEEALRLGAKKVTMEELFYSCDIISLHAALNQENQGMITGDLLRMIKPGAMLVNTARAGLIEEQALYEELETRRFLAILDVYHREPLPAEDPMRTMDHVLLFPHMAGPTFDMREKVVLELLKDITSGKGKEQLKSYIPYDYAVRMTVS